MRLVAVPAEPTEEMLAAWEAAVARVYEEAGRKTLSMDEIRTYAYRAMIEAAPPSDLPPSLRDRAIEIVGEAVTTLRPFSSKPMGGEGSAVRLQQNDQIEAHRKLASLLLELKERGDG